MDPSTRTRRPRIKIQVRLALSRPRIRIRIARILTTTIGRGITMAMAIRMGIINHFLRTARGDMMGRILVSVSFVVKLRRIAQRTRMKKLEFQPS